MAEFPALPLWTDAYLADTRHLSTLEHGAYLLLLIEAWRRPSCSLPEHDATLARLAGLTLEEWASVRDTVMAFWKYDGRSKTWTQKRLVKQRDFTEKQSQLQRDKAAKRWKKKKNDDAAAMPEACPSDASISISNSSVSKDTGAEAPIDPVKELFDAGVALLTSTGTSPSQARSLIGKWRKEQGEAAVLAAIVAARDHGVSSPVEWISARFRGASAQEDEVAAIRRATIERYKRAGMVNFSADGRVIQ